MDSGDVLRVKNSVQISREIDHAAVPPAQAGTGAVAADIRQDHLITRRDQLVTEGSERDASVQHLMQQDNLGTNRHWRGDFIREA
jgi:hypothetical protein